MNHLVDLTGKRFGRLIVIKRVENIGHKLAWLCKCDCGNEKVIRGEALKKGNTKSCGCYKSEVTAERNKGKTYTRYNITGKRFGRLVAIKRIENDEVGDYRSCWLCKCDCGNEKIIRLSGLLNGSTSSCGCYKKEQDIERNKKSFGESSKNYILISYKNGAKIRNINFDLSTDKFYELLQQNCFYCGKEPSNIIKSQSNNGDYIYNGIDRIDNYKGYIEGNVVPCCSICNRNKGKMTQEEFILWVEKIYNNLICPHSSMDKSTSLLS